MFLFSDSTNPEDALPLQSDNYCKSVQEQRLRKLQSECQKLRDGENRHKLGSNFHYLEEPPNPKQAQIHYNSQRKISMCTPHKCGSQTWRYFYQKLVQEDRDVDLRSLAEDDFTLVEWPQDAPGYMKAFQVRHPLERLLSSYRFIFERDAMKPTISKINQYIFDHYPDPKQNLTEFDNWKFVPTFKQFCQFVVDSPNDFGLSTYSGVSHWLPYYMTCNPCHPGEKLQFLFIYQTCFFFRGYVNACCLLIVLFVIIICDLQ